MDTASQTEKNRDGIEKRSAFITEETGWLAGRDEWCGLACIGAVHTEFETKKGKTEEWHYYITSRKLTAAQLLHHARMEWAVETMHWLLDVHFGEDNCRVEDRNIQQNLNMLRKAAINLIKRYKERAASKRSMSKIMFDCLLNPYFISDILEN
ncbi:MAG: ISAs1 family transposase [Lachnospiraceae bacterium]|nr:ISAs1 family transposase [Lachnospiraceae bacterium]